MGSTNPGLLTFAIDKFSQVFPDYRDRVLRHEAAHFLIGYLLGVPAIGYDLALGREHTDFAEAKLQKRLFQSQLSDDEVNQLAVVAMAGVAAEAREYDQVCPSGHLLRSLLQIPIGVHAADCTTCDLRVVRARFALRRFVGCIEWWG